MPERGPGETDREIGRLIHDHRERLGITQPDFAAALGFASSRRPSGGGRNATGIAYMESGRRKVTLDVLLAASRHLGFDFVEDLAQVFFNAARLGQMERRDEKLREAGALAQELMSRQPPKAPKEKAS